jgi:hypothetical protein
MLRRHRSKRQGVKLNKRAKERMTLRIHLMWRRRYKRHIICKIIGMLLTVIFGGTSARVTGS